MVLLLFELPSSEDQSLLVGEIAFFVLDLVLEVVITRLFLLKHDRGDDDLCEVNILATECLEFTHVDPGELLSGPRVRRPPSCTCIRVVSGNVSLDNL